LGADGWELTAVLPMERGAPAAGIAEQNNYLSYFKREL
jgi:hypothetical protein